jgi:predicted RNase H-like HicB family nuclease
MKKLLLLLPFLFLAPQPIDALNIGPSAIFDETTEVEDETPVVEEETPEIVEEETPVEEETVTETGITLEELQALIDQAIANLDEETRAELQAVMDELLAAAGELTETTGGIRGMFTVDNIILVVNSIIVIVFTAASIYLRVQVIAQKLFGKRTEEELAEAKARLVETEGQFTMVMGSIQTIGDTLTQVVSASKMSPEDKLKIQDSWAETKVRIQDFLAKQRERIQKYKEAISDAGDSLMEVLGETKDVIEKYVTKDDVQK